MVQKLLRANGEERDEIIVKLIELVKLANATGDSMTLRLLKMALLNEIHILSVEQHWQS